MENREEIRTAEYLLRASPETVYEWLKAWPQRTPEDRSFFWNNIPKEIEQKLLERNNEIVDLALATWGTHYETINTLYHRWCARTVVADWPPQPSTYHYAVLASILANVNVSLFFKSQSLGSTGIPTEDFEWLVEHGDVQGLFCLMHDNIGLGIGLLIRCAEKSGAYSRIDDNRWLSALAMLGNNKSLHRIDTSDINGLDTVYWAIHKAFVQAATISPKTSTGAILVGRLFQEQEQLPSALKEGVYVSEEALAAAVLTWNVEILDDDESESSRLKFQHEYDALRPSERVQFHLLRHYCSYLDLDPDDPVRVRRLAAYSKNPINGGKGWGPGYENQLQKHTGKGLDLESFQRYSERDGPAFMYANSFNNNIWCDEVASETLKYSWWKEAKIKYPCPENQSDMFQNREKCVDDAAAKKSLEASDSSEESDSSELRTLATIGKVREELGQELGQVKNLLNAQIGNLKKWLIWGGIVVVVLLLFRY